MGRRLANYPPIRFAVVLVASIAAACSNSDSDRATSGAIGNDRAAELVDVVKIPNGASYSVERAASPASANLPQNSDLKMVDGDLPPS